MSEVVSDAICKGSLGSQARNWAPQNPAEGPAPGGGPGARPWAVGEHGLVVSLARKGGAVKAAHTEPISVSFGAFLLADLRRLGAGSVQGAQASRTHRGPPGVGQAGVRKLERLKRRWCVRLAAVTVWVGSLVGGCLCCAWTFIPVIGLSDDCEVSAAGSCRGRTVRGGVRRGVWAWGPGVGWHPQGCRAAWGGALEGRGLGAAWVLPACTHLGRPDHDPRWTVRAGKRAVRAAGPGEAGAGRQCR